MITLSGPRNLDLDVDSPDKVIGVLENAVDAFYESASELESAWQSKAAGRPWNVVARRLDKAARDIERDLRKLGY
jgi:hypothetical protein